MRLDLQARYRERFSGQLSYDNEIFTGSGRKALGFAIADERGFDTWIDLDRTISDTHNATWQHLLYRGWVRYAGDDVEVTVGRQRIALGRARLWNPTDLFNPIPPLALEGDQRIGVDSVVTRVRVTGDLWASAIVAPQDRDDLYRSALRLELSRRSLDAALMFARIETDSVYGVDFATNVGDAALRGEGTWSFHEHGGHTTQLVGSLDYTFDIGAGLYVLVEHFYNGNTFSRDALRNTLSRPAAAHARPGARAPDAGRCHPDLAARHGLAQPDGPRPGLRPDTAGAAGPALDPRLGGPERGVLSRRHLVGAAERRPLRRCAVLRRPGRGGQLRRPRPALLRPDRRLLLSLKPGSSGADLHHLRGAIRRRFGWI